jgi:hypothetical protein
MKFIIDCIENVRESIQDTNAYHMRVALLKDDPQSNETLHYAGEASLGGYRFDDEQRKLILSIGEPSLALEEWIASLMILEMDKMMYSLWLEIEVAGTLHALEVVGFGKSQEDSYYILFVKLPSIFNA